MEHLAKLNSYEESIKNNEYTDDMIKNITSTRDYINQLLNKINLAKEISKFNEKYNLCISKYNKSKKYEFNKLLDCLEFVKIERLDPVKHSTCCSYHETNVIVNLNINKNIYTIKLWYETIGAGGGGNASCANNELAITKNNNSILSLYVSLSNNYKETLDWNNKSYIINNDLNDAGFNNINIIDDVIPIIIKCLNISTTNMNYTMYDTSYYDTITVGISKLEEDYEN
jgi:hypothetical protein